MIPASMGVSREAPCKTRATPPVAKSPHDCATTSFDALPLGADRAAYRSGRGLKPIDLLAPALVAHGPCAEVLTVVGQDAIAAFPQARACPLHDFATIEAHCVMSYSDAAALSETLQRNILHRSVPYSAGKPPVVNDTAVADIEAVVAVERPRGDEMSRERRFVIGLQRRIAPEEALVGVLTAATIGCSPKHDAYARQPCSQTRLHDGVDRYDRIAWGRACNRAKRDCRKG